MVGSHFEGISQLMLSTEQREEHLLRISKSVIAPKKKWLSPVVDWVIEAHEKGLPPIAQVVTSNAPEFGSSYYPFRFRGDMESTSVARHAGAVCSWSCAAIIHTTRKIPIALRIL